MLPITARLPAILAAVLLVAAPAALADPITFGSYAGATPTGLSNGAITYNNTGSNAPQTSLKTGSVSYLYDSYYVSPFSNTTWISYDPNSAANNDPSGTTIYTTSYTGNLAGYIGSISILADDNASVYLNNVLIGTVGFNTPTIFNIAAGDYINGTNTFVFDVTNGPGVTGFDFKGTAVAVTPEVSSLILLGTGTVFMVGAARRRLSSKSKAVSTTLP